jgi:pectin methylesterase-like acyl-CoA thioesterase
MKRVMFFLFTLAIAFGTLTACSSTPAPTVTVTATAPAPAPTTQAPAPVDQDALYLSIIRSANPMLNQISDSTLIGAGKKACSMLDSGSTFLAVVESMMTAANGDRETAKAFGSILAGAVNVYCPAYIPAMKDYLASQGVSA